MNEAPEERTGKSYIFGRVVSPGSEETFVVGP